MRRFSVNSGIPSESFSKDQAISGSQKENTMVRPLGSMHGPEEPQHSGFDPNDPAETTRPHGSTPPRETQEAQAAETPNGAAHQVISALAGDPLGASPALSSSNGDRPARVARTITDTVLPENVKQPGIIEQLPNPKDQFSKEELATAMKLAEEGYNVKQLPRRNSKTADALVNRREI